MDTYCFDVDLLDAADPVNGEDFVVTFSLDEVVPVKVSGWNTMRTEVEAFVLVTVIGAIHLSKILVLCVLKLKCWIFFVE